MTNHKTRHCCDSTCVQGRQCPNRAQFAPGVIEHHRRNRSSTSALVRWLARAAVLLTLAACVAAYLQGGAL